MRGGEAQPLDAYDAARGGGQRQLEPLALVGRQIRGDRRPLRHGGLDLRPGEARRVGEREVHGAGGACEHRGGVGCDHRDPEQIAVALLHRHQRKRGEQKRQEQGEAVAVVESGEQHEEQQQAERRSGAGRQDIEPAALERDRQDIRALAAAHPIVHACAHQGRERGERVPAAPVYAGLKPIGHFRAAPALPG